MTNSELILAIQNAKNYIEVNKAIEQFKKELFDERDKVPEVQE